MRIIYTSGSPEEILEAIKEQLSNRKLGKIVSFELKNADLEVTIKKMGSSHLYFTCRLQGEGVIWELTKEKIALSHKAFKQEVMDKITKIIENTGGDIVLS